MPIAKSQPLKLRSVDNGDLQRLSSTEENYLAYLVGSHLIESDSDVGNITLSSSGNTLIGSFVDTYFNEPDGTHPSSSITSSSVTTNLYQIAGIADESDSDFRRPVAYDNGVREMADSDLNVLVDRINGRIAQSDYLGQFYLGTSAPSADYNVFISGAFSDTINDSTVNTYNIYRRETQSAPSSILDSASNPTLIMSVKRSLGDSGDFEGLQRMTERQVKVTLGQRAKTRRASANGIGSYQLRSSSQGAPTTGLWRSVGTASNTQKTTAEVSYTKLRSSSYNRDRISTFSRDRTQVFTGNFIGTYSRTFVGNYIGNYTRTFTGNYAGEFTRNRSSAYTRTSTRTRISAYTRTRIQNRTSAYTRTSTRTLYYTRNSTRTSTANFVGDFIGERQTNFTRTRVSSYSRFFTVSFVGTYSRAVTSTINYTRNRLSTLSYTRVRSCTSTFIGNFTGTQTYTRFGPEPEPYTRQVVSARSDNSTRLFTGNYSRTVTYTGNYGRTEIIGDVGYTRTILSTRSESYSRNFIGDFIGNFTGNFTNTRSSSYAGDFIGDYTRTGYYTGNYSRTFVGDYIGNYSRGFIGNYGGNYSRTFVGNYSRDFVNNNVVSYTRDSTRNNVVGYTRERQTAFTGNFTGNYARTIIDSYTRNVTDSFIGDTIQSTTSVVQTYTLYVRYA